MNTIMKAKISFGKVDGYRNGRKSCELCLNMELRLNHADKIVLSVTADLWNTKHTDIIRGGQCVDDLWRLHHSEMADRFLYKEIMQLWEKYHLNDAKEGTPKQRQALKEVGYFNNNYNKCVEYLKEINLYDDNGFLYGHGWYYDEIPQVDLERIKSIITEANNK